RLHAHRVGSREQVAEGVAAVAGGRGGRHDVAVAVEQVDGDAVQARFAGLLGAVAVEVVPHAGADAGAAAAAEVDLLAVLAGLRGNGTRVLGRGAGGADRRGRAAGQGGGVHADGVGAGAEAGEGVVAVGAGRGGRDDV